MVAIARCKSSPVGTKNKETVMGSGSECKPMREKYWSEMNQEERIEKLLYELIRTQHQLREVSKVSMTMLYHSHSDGVIVTKVTSSLACNERPRFYIYEKQ